MKARTLALIFGVATLAGAGGVHAQGCTARVLLPVTDDLGNAWSPGKTLPVDIARDGPGGGLLCASGGACIPRQRQGAVALQLLNCRIGPTIASGDHRLVPDSRLASPASVRQLRDRDAAMQRLVQLGLPNAAAGSLADEYVNRPGSKTAQLVTLALAGSAKATASLRAR